MDGNRVKFAMMLAVGLAAIFLLIMLRRFLGVVKLSLRAVICMVVLVAMCVAFWSLRDPLPHNRGMNRDIDREEWSSQGLTPG